MERSRPHLRPRRCLPAGADDEHHDEDRVRAGEDDAVRVLLVDPRPHQLHGNAESVESQLRVS